MRDLLNGPLPMDGCPGKGGEKSVDAPRVRPASMEIFGRPTISKGRLPLDMMIPVYNTVVNIMP